MAFETGTSNLQANQLSEFIHQLNSIKNQLNDFCFSIERNWNGQEVIYYRKAIETIQNKINSINNQLQSVSDDIKNTAVAIRQEDLAAEAAARALAEKNRKISIAQTNYNNAYEECEDLYKERELLEAKLKERMTATKRRDIQKQLDELYDKIMEAEENRDNLYRTLAALRR